LVTSKLESESVLGDEAAVAADVADDAEAGSAVSRMYWRRTPTRARSRWNPRTTDVKDNETSTRGQLLGALDSATDALTLGHAEDRDGPVEARPKSCVGRT
jgi:myo-inositol catabolism protein IolC